MNKWLNQKAVLFVPLHSSFHLIPIPDSRLRFARKNSYRTTCNINFNISWTWMMIDDIFSHTCLASCPTFERVIYIVKLWLSLVVSTYFFPEIIINFYCSDIEIDRDMTYDEGSRRGCERKKYEIKIILLPNLQALATQRRWWCFGLWSVKWSWTAVINNY